MAAVSRPDASSLVRLEVSGVWYVLAVLSR